MFKTPLGAPKGVLNYAGALEHTRYHILACFESKETNFFFVKKVYCDLIENKCVKMKFSDLRSRFRIRALVKAVVCALLRWIL